MYSIYSNQMNRLPNQNGGHDLFQFKFSRCHFGSFPRTRRIGYCSAIDVFVYFIFVMIVNFVLWLSWIVLLLSFIDFDGIFSHNFIKYCFKILFCVTAFFIISKHAVFIYQWKVCLLFRYLQMRSVHRVFIKIRNFPTEGII